ncbi:MAG: glycosyltransferase family 39 protein [Myxococcota bacterium]
MTPAADDDANAPDAAAPPTRARDGGARAGDAIGPAALALAFFALGVLASPDVGATADELETLRAGQRNLEIVAAWVAGRPAPAWSFHELTGYYFALDTLRALAIRALAAAGLDDALRALHLAQLALASATVFALARLARAAGASARGALFTALALATLPPFVAHAQNNPKDLPATFALVLAALALLRAARGARPRDAVIAGLAIGLALTTRVHAVFGLAAAWLYAIAATERPTRRHVAAHVVALAVGLGAALAFWPWLWPAPLERLTGALHDVGTKVFTIPVLYLGRVLPANEVPWHYRFVLLLASTPLSVLALVAAGIAAVRARGAPEGARRAAVLGSLWCACYALAEAVVWSRYDGVRHFLVALPGVALLAGAGADWAWERGRVGRVAALAPFALAVAGVVAVHPYANAFLNPVARLLARGPTDATFEIEYWGQSYLEAARWLAKHAEPTAEVVVPQFAALAEHELDLPVREAGVREWRATDRPRYLVVMSRRAYWSPPLADVARTEAPVFEIRRSGGQLLAIYRNAAPR